MTPEYGSLEWVEWQADQWAQYVRLWGGSAADFYWRLGPINRFLGAGDFQGAARATLDACIGLDRPLG